MELLDCTSAGADVGCSLEVGRLTATNVAVTGSGDKGIQVLQGDAELSGCSVTRSHGYGMLFGGHGFLGDGRPSAEARLQHCTVVKSDSGGFYAREGLSLIHISEPTRPY